MRFYTFMHKRNTLRVVRDYLKFTIQNERPRITSIKVIAPETISVGRTSRLHVTELRSVIT